MNLVEKIVKRYVVGASKNRKIKAGDFVFLRPAHVMTHDNTGPVISKFEALGCNQIHNTKQPVFTLDHDIQNTSPENLAKYDKCEPKMENILR